VILPQFLLTLGTFDAYDGKILNLNGCGFIKILPKHTSFNTQMIELSIIDPSAGYTGCPVVIDNFLL